VRRRLLAAGLASMALAAGPGDAVLAEGGPQADLRRLFPREASLEAQTGSLSRLLLPPDVLAACRPDLSDLRLFDAAGQEIPFLVDAGLPPPGVLEAVQRFEPRLVEAERHEVHRETGPTIRRERFDFALPASPPRTGSWVLTFQIGAAEVVARARVEGIGSSGEASLLLEDASIFRLPGSHAAEKLRLPLPPFRGSRLRVALETEHPFWLQPAFRLESARILEQGSRIAVPLEIASTESGEGRTVVSLVRPRGIVPDLLRLETSTGTFDRQVQAWDEGAAGLGQALGSGRIFRVEAFAPVGEQEMALQAARGDRLRLEIDDGDSPPLADLSVSAVIRQPALIFSLREGGDGPAVLRFGGGRARRPRYDLVGLLPPPDSVTTGKRADAAALLYDPATVRTARLGATRPNPEYDGAPALAFAMRPGAEMDRGLYSHHRAIIVPAATEGLSRVRLRPEDLAVLSEDLSDLRVIDDDARQWPYLVEREAAVEHVPLTVAGPERRDRTSRYDLSPPVSPLAVDRILLETGAGYFDRAFTLEAEPADGPRRAIARGRLARPIGDPRAASIDLAPARVVSLHLAIEDGDDAPLAFQSVRARVLLPEVYLTAPAGRYELLMGAAGQSAPRYELERVREVVLAVQAATVEPGALAANPDYSLGARLKGRGLRQTILLWGALIAAVVILGGLTLRLARREPTSAG
jgi:hypothetical protein